MLGSTPWHDAAAYCSWGVFLGMVNSSRGASILGPGRAWHDDGRSWGVLLATVSSDRGANILGPGRARGLAGTRHGVSA